MLHPLVFTRVCTDLSKWSKSSQWPTCALWARMTQTLGEITAGFGSCYPVMTVFRDLWDPPGAPGEALVWALPCVPGKLWFPSWMRPCNCVCSSYIGERGGQTLPPACKASHALISFFRPRSSCPWLGGHLLPFVQIVFNVNNLVPWPHHEAQGEGKWLHPSICFPATGQKRRGPAYCRSYQQEGILNPS